MSNNHANANRFMLLLAAAAAALLLAAPASAEEMISRGPPSDDPVLFWSQQIAPSNQFFINNNEDVEVIRFKKVHDVQVCAAAAHTGPEGNVAGYPLKAMWDTESAVITPGNCMAFDARSVKVRAGSELPDGIILTGTVKVMK